MGFFNSIGGELPQASTVPTIGFANRKRPFSEYAGATVAPLSRSIRWAGRQLPELDRDHHAGEARAALVAFHHQPVGAQAVGERRTVGLVSQDDLIRTISFVLKRSGAL